MYRTVLPAVFLVWISMHYLLAIGQERVVVVPSAPTCPDCRIELEHLVTLGTSDDPLTPLPVTNVARDPEGSFYVAPTFSPGEIAVYDASGAFIKALGGSGQGPGEFGLITQIFADDSGALHVFDEGRRYTVLTPGVHDVQWARPLEAAGSALVAESGHLVVGRVLATNEDYDLVSVLSPRGEFVTSFASAAVVADRWDRYRHFARASGGNVWVAPVNRYRFELWSLAGERLRVVERDAQFFEPWRGHNPEEPYQAAPRPRLRSLYQSDERTLWVMIQVADEHWRPEPGPRAPRPLSALGDRSDYYDTILEVIDLERNEVVARTRMPERLSRFRGLEGFVSYPREGEDGMIAVDVYQPRLLR